MKQELRERVVLAVLKDLHEHHDPEGILLIDIGMISMHCGNWEELLDNYANQIIHMLSKDEGVEDNG